MISTGSISNRTGDIWSAQESSGYGYSNSDGTTSTASVLNGVALGTASQLCGISSTQYEDAINGALSSTVSSLAKIGTSSQLTGALGGLTSSRSSLLSRFNLAPSKTTLSGIGASSIKRSNTFGLTAAETLSSDLLSSTASSLYNNSPAENQAISARMGVTLDNDDLSTLETATIASERSWTTSNSTLASNVALNTSTTTYDASSSGLLAFMTSAQDCGFSTKTISGFGNYYSSSPTLLMSSSSSDSLGSASLSDLSAYGSVGDSLAMTNMKSQIDELISRSTDRSTNTNLFNTAFYDSVTKNAGSVVSSLAGGGYNTTTNSSALTKILTNAISSGAVSSSTVSSAISVITGGKVTTQTSKLLASVMNRKTLTNKDVVAVGAIATSLGTSISDYFKNSGDSVTYTKDGDVIRWNNGTTTSASDNTIHWNDATVESADSKLVSAYAPELDGLYGGSVVTSGYF